jgi:A/G-specific adenine glycosylase
MLGRNSDFARRLLSWYDAARRDLPWRTTDGRAPDPYHVFVSEAMLQQTQVATVIGYYHRFLERFPALGDLAAATEQDVLRLWQGLGYYSRARNLHAAAKTVVSEYGGRLPEDRDELLKLPGVGRYTAGAVASIAFGQRVPILDGNVIRVLCRIDRITSDPRDRTAQQLLWRRAEEILPRQRVGDFNSALMELGALVCIPRTPQCLTCPVRRHCSAFAAGVQDKIPAPRATKETPLLRRRTFCIRHGQRWLIEQRPAKGRWAGMWQFVTREADGADDPPLPVLVRDRRRLGTITHGLTHRRYEFEVFQAEAARKTKLSSNPPQRWVTFKELDRYPLPRPHLRIVQLLHASADDSAAVT